MATIVLKQEKHPFSKQHLHTHNASY